MKLKLAINGFGRIGRGVLRAIHESGRDDVEIVAINDLAPVEANAQMLKYDSVHGRMAETVTTQQNKLIVAGKAIRFTSERDPSNLPWDDVDIALECTGIFTNAEAASKHLLNGSKKVLVSAPCKGVEKTIVYGVNHDILSASDTVVSNASCTTNCLAPLAKVLDDAFGIETAYMTTIHAYTGGQPTLDRYHKDPRRARAAAMSMIPTTTGAAVAIALVLPNLKGKIEGCAMRVPTPNVSCVDLCFMPKTKTTVKMVNDKLRSASEGPLKGVLEYAEEPLVSIDFNHDPASSIFVPDQTAVTDGGMVRVMAWYDNEWGFSNRMIDTAVAMGKAT